MGIEVGVACRVYMDVAEVLAKVDRKSTTSAL